MKFSATDVVVCVRENGISISGSQHGRKSLRRNLRRTQTTFSRERSGKKSLSFLTFVVSRALFAVHFIGIRSFVAHSRHINFFRALRTPYSICCVFFPALSPNIYYASKLPPTTAKQHRKPAQVLVFLSSNFFPAFLVSFSS